MSGCGIHCKNNMDIRAAPTQRKTQPAKNAHSKFHFRTSKSQFLQCFSQSGRGPKPVFVAGYVFSRVGSAPRMVASHECGRTAGAECITQKNFDRMTYRLRNWLHIQPATQKMFQNWLRNNFWYKTVQYVMRTDMRTYIHTHMHRYTCACQNCTYIYGEHSTYSSALQDYFQWLWHVRKGFKKIILGYAIQKITSWICFDRDTPSKPRRRNTSSAQPS